MPDRTKRSLINATDNRLIELANEGNCDALTEIYERHKSFVLRHATRISGNYTDGQDVLQEVFSHLFRLFPGFELRCSLTTYLYPVIRNISLKYARKRHREPSIDTNEVEIEASDQKSGIDPLQDEKNEIKRNVAALSDPLREVVELRFGEDMSLKEISDFLDMPLGTVKSRLHKALLELKKKLTKN